MKGMSKMEPCLIIAEAGVNHNGSLELAKKLVDVGIESNVDIIKFQTFQVDEIVSFNTKKASYQERAKEKNQYEMLKNLELSFEEFHELKNYCDYKGIEFMSTPYDIKSVKFLNEIDVKRFKIASADIINKPLLREVAKSRKQIILSCGMATLSEIERTLIFIKGFGNHNIIILHCTTNYPTLFDQINMNVMTTLRETFHLPVGYSDHSIGIEIPIMAVSLGAKVIEKHFTLDRKMEGPDHFASLEPNELRKMVDGIRNVEEAFGNRIKNISEEEEKNIFFMRRSIHLNKDVKKGDLLTKELIKITRPFDGIEPWLIDRILNKKFNKNKNENEEIQWDDIM